MQDTPFSDMYSVKKKEANAERISFLALLHKIPKQIADAGQTQGVSEKFLENGMPSGILTPSQISHDRMLSATDAVQDAFIIGILLAFLPLFEYGLWMSIFVLLLSVYWFFHVGWWEKGKAWDIKASVKRYLRNTYNYYWAVFSVLIVIVSVSMWYLIFWIGAHIIALRYANIGLDVVSGAERSFSSVFSQGWFDPRAQHSIDIKGNQYQARFAFAFAIFTMITVSARLYFVNFYKAERIINEEQSTQELSYTVESALRKLDGGN